MSLKTFTCSSIALAVTLFFFTLFFAFCLPAAHAADQLCFSWTYPDDTQITGYRLLKDSHANVAADNIAPGERSICIPDPLDQGNHNYFLVAVNGELLSGNSDIALVKQKITDPPAAAQPPISVGGFEVTVTVKPLE